jgi:hypothetical protein
VRAVVYPNPTELPRGVRRDATRPLAYRSADYQEKFDDTTLFYDSFVSDSDHEVILLGPPFLNFLSLLEKMEVIAQPSGEVCVFRIRTMDRHSRITVPVPPKTENLLIKSGVHSLSIRIGDNQSAFFENRRVLFTLSKNNRLQWVRDWLRYNRDIHGANAVLFFDNGSTIYSAAELLEAMCAVSGIERVCVVVWPFKYGPQGSGAEHWDSDFCQSGAWEEARWRFLQRARSALNSDVDELVVSKRGASIFEATERARGGIVRFHGLWVHGFSNRTGAPDAQSPAGYTSFDHFRKPPLTMKYGFFPIFRGDCPSKWAVVPRRCPEEAQWTAHGINDWRNARAISRKFCYRHFREINDNWKYDRSQRETFDPEHYAYDVDMLSSFRRVDWLK